VIPTSERSIARVIEPPTLDPDMEIPF